MSIASPFKPHHRAFNLFSMEPSLKKGWGWNHGVFVEVYFNIFATSSTATLSGSGKKGKRIEVDLISEKEQSNSAFGDNVPSSLVDCFGCNSASYSTSFSRNCGIKSHQESLSREATLCSGTANANNEGNTNGEHQKCSNQITAKSRKRLRQFSWQCYRKHRQLDIQETYSSTQCTRTMSDGERPSERPQSHLNTSSALQEEAVRHLNAVTTRVANPSHDIHALLSVLPFRHCMTSPIFC